MKQIAFVKYQGTGNDFVMLDNLSGKYDNLSISDIQYICDRKFGVGADGLIKLNKKDGVDFYVDYYNSDGSQSFCGNGARCAVAFAKELGVIDQNTVFDAIDGVHAASIDGTGLVSLKMSDVRSVSEEQSVFVIDTGSPHYIDFSNDEDIVEFGKRIRYSDRFRENGINVNQVREENKNTIRVLTYERGVEDETLSCGTGVTACALAQMKRIGLEAGRIEVSTKGGDLAVEAKMDGNGFNEVYLIGPAERVFSGTIEFDQ